MEQTPEGHGGETLAVTGRVDSHLPVGDRKHLLVFSGSASWLYQIPSEGQVVIGRSEAADLRIDDASVSRQHARLEIESDGITITDLGSQNGTFVNHVRIDGSAELHPNDVITIQKTTLILHTTSATGTAAVVLALPELRERLTDEIDRAVRYERNVTLLCLCVDAATEPRPLERLVAEQLRRIDSVAWSSGALYLLLAEAGTDEAITIATRLRSRIAPAAAARFGYATCPADGCDADTLLASAHNAALGAAVGEIGSSTRAFQTLAVGSQRVIVADPAVVRLYALIERLAPVDLPVLVMGETGSGKELAASAIHEGSPRHARQMVSLNCAALQETLAESELFGHEKGAFSGAVATKVGVVEAASGSTLFLDEVGELSPAVQAKLLRVLETQRMTRVGDVREREVDVRIVAATNRDLHEEIAAGRFRQDLFFRLSAATLHIPPLRDRPRELPLLATAFLTEACKRSGRSIMTISEAAMTALLAHRWPGNVRELKNLMQYVAAAHPTDIVTVEHVTERLVTPGTAPRSREAPGERGTFRPLAEEIRELEMQRIREALDAAAGNQTRAAALLAMPVRTFYEKVKQYGLTPKRRG